MPIKELMQSATSGAIGMGLQAISQPLLQGQNLKNQKKLAQYQQQLALDTWNKTNYEAQREHMEKAGLNVGLMYGMGGGGGATTSGGQGGGIGYAPDATGMGMQIGLQTQLLQAQKENIEADTNLKNVEAGRKGGVETEKLQQELANLKIQEQIQKIEQDIKDKSKEEIIASYKHLNDKLAGEAKQAMAKGNVAEATQQEQIQIIQQEVTESLLRISLQRAGLIKTGAETDAVKAGIKKMQAEIDNMLTQRQQDYQRLNQTERELLIKTALARVAKEQQEFNTSTPEQIHQWVNIFTDILDSAMGAIKKK